MYALAMNRIELGVITYHRRGRRQCIFAVKVSCKLNPTVLLVEIDSTTMKKNVIDSAEKSDFKMILDLYEFSISFLK